MKETKNNLNRITVDYKSKRIQHPLTINNTRISKYMKEFQAPQKRWTTKEETGRPKSMKSGMAYISCLMIMIMIMMMNMTLIRIKP
jgi:hypothetical protein